MIRLVVVAAAIFSPLAAAMAFLITYEELSHHRLGRKDRLRHSLNVAIATLTFFLAIAIFVGWLLDHLTIS